MRLTARRFDDIAPDREKGCLNFLYVLVARVKLDQPELAMCAIGRSTIAL
jgi:hypothetical protein